MSTSYEATGRTRQKARTRSALIEATRELLAAGTTPTVEQAADRAGISRTTAYRYFTNRGELLAATYPDIERGSLLGTDAPADPHERFDAIVDLFVRHVVEFEPELRAQLRLALSPELRGDAELPLRSGRAIVWLEDALAPFGLPARKSRRLAIAIRAAAGIETLVWMTDIAGLSRREAASTMRTTARALLDAALRERDARLS
jgi:AcrR family transcriptional regulator